LCPGLGRIAPTDNTHKKTRFTPRFLICRDMLELRSKPPSLTFLERKVNQRTFTPNIPIYFGKTFEVQRNFSRKVSLVRVPRRIAPTDNTHTKSTAQAVLFYIIQPYQYFPRSSFWLLISFPTKRHISNSPKSLDVILSAYFVTSSSLPRFVFIIIPFPEHIRVFTIL